MGRTLLTSIMILASSYSLADFDLPEFSGFIAGAITQDNLPYANVDVTHQPSVLILGRLGDVFIEGNRAGYPLKRLGWGTLSALGKIRNHQYLEADDSALIDEDKKRAVELGPQLSVPLGGGYVSQFTLFQDVSGAHESQEFEASVYKRWNIEKLQLVGTLAAQYQTQDLMNYYVGTDGYSADAELTSEIELLATYDITKDWSAIAVWRYYKHGSDFKNSPLTDGDTTQRLALGIGRFF